MKNPHYRTLGLDYQGVVARPSNCTRYFMPLNARIGPNGPRDLGRKTKTELYFDIKHLAASYHRLFRRNLNPCYLHENQNGG